LYDSEFWNTVSGSLRYTAISVGVELVLGLIIALLLQRQTRINNAISVLLLLPLMTAPAIAALMWKLMTNPNFGILSYLVSLVGISDFRWASSPSSALVHGDPGRRLGLHAVHHGAAAGGIASLPQQPFEAAALDGVPRLFVFFRITLPIAVALYHHRQPVRLLDAIQQFDIIYAMTQGGPGNTLLVFQVRAYLEFYQYTNVGKSAALLVVLWAITYFLSNIFIQELAAPARAQPRVGLGSGPAMDRMSFIERGFAACCWP